MAAPSAHVEAAEAWREGRLVDARERYEQVLRGSPGDWQAAFQLAWLDGAFGRLTPDQARRLDRPDLSAEARQRVGALVAQAEAGPRLPGAEADWDIGALLARGRTQGADWWEERARAAWRSGLFGLAAACVAQAAERSPGTYHDPPRWTQGIPLQAEEHLRIVAGATA